MKTFTSKDIETAGSMPRINCGKDDLIIQELIWQQAGLSQTASGYGRKLTTRYMIHFNGKLRRVYCCQISNAGTCYIVHNGAWLVIDAM